MLTMTRRGGIPFCSLTISADTSSGYNALTEAAAAGFNTSAPLNVLITVASGIFVGGEMVIANFALGSTVKLVNNGHIYGAGGAAGSGSGGGGLAGGNAIRLNLNDITIDNTNGEIFGGGGGGGGGAEYHSGSAGGQGGGGGGGFGYPGGAHGIAGGFGSAGQPGTDGSRTAAGVGGAGGIDAFFHVSGEVGGNGGGAGAAGSPGQSTATATGGPGGAAGTAIVTNGVTVTWQGGFNATQVKGAIV